MNQPLRLLQIEDSENDAALIVRLLNKSDYAVKSRCVETADDLRNALDQQAWDIIISDYSMPLFSAPAALAILKETGHDIPFIVVSGNIGEEPAVSLMKAGAQDYLMKDHLARLVPAVARELIETENRAKRRQAEAEVRRQRNQLESLLKERTAELTVTQARLQFILTESPVVVYTCQASGDFGATFISENIRAQLGYEPADFINDPQFWKDRIHPDDAERAFANLAHLNETEIHSHEYRFRQPDGSYRWMHDELRLIRDADGEPSEIVGGWMDVTDRMEIEEALRTSENRLRDLFDNSSDLIQSVSLEGNIIFVNKAWRETLGYSEDELADINLFQIIHEDCVEHCSLIFQRLLAGEDVGVIEVVFKTKDGRRIELEGNVNPHAEDGKIVATRGIFRDVTARKQAEEKLQHSRNQLDIAMNVAKLGAWELDLDSMLLTWTDHFYKLFGTTADQEGGYQMTMERFLSDFCAPEDGPIIAKELASALAAPDTSRIITMEYRGVRRNDGAVRDLMARYQLACDATGKATHAWGSTQDITERKLIERELAHLNSELEQRVEAQTREVRQALATLDATADAAFIFDPDNLRFSYVNQGAMQQLGYTREELLKMTPVEIKPDLDDTGFRDMLAPMLSGKTQSKQFIIDHRHKDGHTIPVEISLQYVDLVDESPRFIAIARDITERVKLEKQANRSQRLEAIGALAGGVAHDLNNALSPIMMSVDLLQMEFPENSEIVEMLRSSTQRGADMVRQLLSFAKGAEGEHVSIEPTHLLKEMENLIRGSFPKNIQLEIHLDSELPVILGDATQLHQVLLNLCVNARDAMPLGGTLTLEAMEQEVDSTFASSNPNAKPGKYLAIRVSDTGEGIPSDVIDLIFDPFFTTKAPDKGTGLGLSTVSGIIKGHNGFMQVYSKPDQGTTFTVYLQLDFSGNSPAPIVKENEAFRGQGETVLFVDDETNIRDIAAVVLRRFNLKPLTATDGADGLMQLSKHREDVRAIITDMHMPHMDGLAFVRAVRRLLPEVPVIVCSGRMADKEKAEFVALEVMTFLNKPFTESQLATALKSTLSSPTAVLNSNANS